MTWCNGYHGPTIGIGWTKDFKTLPPDRERLPALQPQRRALPAQDRRQLRDALPAVRQRPHAVRRHLLQREPRPDLLGQAPARDGAGRELLAGTKVGAGPVPIETTEGWLLIYHGVLTSCNGFVYSASAALLDLEKPWKVIARAKPYLISPQTLYECVGDVPNVVFPCAALCDAATGRLAIYYGAADTVTGLAFAQVDELVEFAKKNSL